MALFPGRYSRTQQLPIDAERIHRTETCAACCAALGETGKQRAYTARYEIDLVRPDNGGNGLVSSRPSTPIWVVLDHPELPLTNNVAERALRHWGIARRISHGTRTPQGTHAFSLLASVIETCRRRAFSPWPYLADVVRLRRKGLPAPALPVPAT